MKLTKSLYPFLQLGSFYLIVNLILRVILIFHPITQSSFGLGAVLKIMLLGVVSDFFVFTLASVFLWLYQLFLSDSKYHKPWGYLIFGLLSALLLYVSFFNTILNEYGGVVPTIGIALIGLKTVLFGLLLFIVLFEHLIFFLKIFFL